MLPVITAAAPPTALRIRKLRRSTPGGTAFEINAIVPPSGSVTLVLFDGSFELTVSSIALFFFLDMIPLLTFNLFQITGEPHSVRSQRLANFRFHVHFFQLLYSCAADRPIGETRYRNTNVFEY